MKKIMLMVLSVALCASCAAKKPVQQPVQQSVQQQVDPQQAKLDSLRRAQEIRRIELQMQAEEADMQAQLEIAKLKADNAKRATSKRVAQDLYLPCIDESYDKPGEYMAALGIAEGEIERGPAQINANRYAIANIASRYIGVIKNGISQFAKNDNTRTGQSVKENQLEGLAQAVGEKAINKYAEVVCTKFEQDDMGTYTCYIAVHVPLKNALDAFDEVVDELGVLQNDYDREKCRNWMEAELNKQAAAKEAEKKELQDLRQQLGE